MNKPFLANFESDLIVSSSLDDDSTVCTESTETDDYDEILIGETMTKSIEDSDYDNFIE